MRSIKLLLLVLPVLFFIGCNSKVSAYRQIRKATGVRSDSNYICLIYYKPLQCLNCNALLANLIKGHRRTYDCFIVFPGIRGIELADYQRNLAEQGNIFLPVINDRQLYDKGLSLAGINAATSSAALLLLFSPHTPRVFSFDLKGDAEAAAKIDQLINTRQ